MPAPVRASLGIQKHCFFIVFCFSSEPDRRPARGILVCLAQDTPLVVSRWKRCGTSLLFFSQKSSPRLFLYWKMPPRLFLYWDFFFSELFQVISYFTPDLFISHFTPNRGWSARSRFQYSPGFKTTRPRLFLYSVFFPRNFYDDKPLYPGFIYQPLYPEPGMVGQVTVLVLACFSPKLL